MHIDMSNSFKGKKDNNRLYFIYVVTNMIDMDNLLSLLEFTHFYKNHIVKKQHQKFFYVLIFERSEYQIAI